MSGCEICYIISFVRYFIKDEILPFISHANIVDKKIIKLGGDLQDLEDKAKDMREKVFSNFPLPL